MKISPIRSGVLAEALKKKDRLTEEMLDEGARYLAAGLVSIVNFHNPPRIILGGGVIDAVDRLFDQTVQRVRQEALSVPREAVEIVKAALGDFSGIVGAAVHAANLPDPVRSKIEAARSARGGARHRLEPGCLLWYHSERINTRKRLIDVAIESVSPTCHPYRAHPGRSGRAAAGRRSLYACR